MYQSTRGILRGWNSLPDFRLYQRSNAHQEDSSVKQFPFGVYPVENESWLESSVKQSLARTLKFEQG